MSDYVRFRISLAKSLRNKNDTLEIEILPSGEKFRRKIKGFGSLDFMSYLSNIESASNLNSATISEKREQLKLFGGQLFKLIFYGELSKKYEQIIQLGKPLLLEICGEDPKLQSLPWEFIYDTKYRQFLTHLDTIPVVRLIELPRLVTPHPVEKLSVLVAISSPKDLSPLNVLQEKRNIQLAFQDLKDNIEVEFLENADFSKLSDKLLSNKYNVLHFIGHGGISSDLNMGYICLENRVGQAELISGESLGLLLRNARTIHLVVLNACESARATWPTSTVSMANALISMDVPSVVAMQYPISDQAALAFSSAFYSAIAQGYDITRAMAQARRRIHHDTVDIGSYLIHEWGIPVMFLGSDAISEFVFTKSNNLSTSVVLGKTSQWEYKYLNSIINLGRFQKTTEMYIQLRTIPQRLWDDANSTLTAMRSGLPDQDDISLTQQQVSLQLLDEIAKHDRVIVLGKSGSGKTTTLRYLLQQYASLSLQDNLIAKLPIFASLSEYKPEQSIIEFLNKQILEFGENSEFSKHLSENLHLHLKEGRLVILFDGLNEITHYRDGIKALSNFMRIYPSNKYIFTSRDSDYRGELNIEAQLYIDQLDDKQIAEFVEWQQIPGVNGTLFVQRLREKQLIGIARSPFMLPILVKTVSDKALNDNVQNRARLIFWAINKMWTREHNRQERQGEWIDETIETAILKNMAFRMNDQHITKIEILAADAIARETLDEIRDSIVDKKKAINQAIDAGILRITGEHLAFQHDLLRDYFVALKLKSEFKSKIPNTILTNPAWSESIVMLAGLLLSEDGAGAYDLIKLILEQPEDLFLSNLWLAAKCCSEIKSSDLRMHHVEKRVIVEVIKEFSTSKYTILRRRAEDVLVEIGNNFVVNRLEEFIEDVDSLSLTSDRSLNAQLRVRSIEVIGKIGTPQAITVITQILENPKYSKSMRVYAADALRNFDNPISDAILIKIAKDETQEWQVRKTAISSLGKLNKEIDYHELFNLIIDQSKKSMVREEAVAALKGFIGNDDIENFLINLVKDSKQRYTLRNRASYLLVFAKSAQARELFIQILRDSNDDDRVRTKASLCLGNMGNPNDLSLLSDIAQDHRNSKNLRWNAVYGIGYILQKFKNPSTIKFLCNILENETENHYVRWTAAYALGFSKDQYGLQRLYQTALLRSTLPDVKERIIEAISKYQIDDAADMLIKLYNIPEQDSDTKAAIILGLCKVGGEQSREILTGIIKSSSVEPDIQGRILFAVGIQGDETDIPLLQKIIDNSTIPIRVRDTAFTALEKISRRLRRRISNPEPQKEVTMTIEILGFSILTKAVNFLFDEAKKTLDQRREAKKTETETETKPLPIIPMLDQDKNIVLKSKISEKGFNAQKLKIEAVLSEIEHIQNNIQNTRITIVSQGGLNQADLRWRNQLRENQDELLDASQRLEQLISNIMTKE